MTMNKTTRLLVSALIIASAAVAMGQEPKKYDMTSTRTFDAPIERVWQAWTDAKLVMQWWGPKGFTCPEAKMDFREGGKSLVCMRFGKQDMYNTWTYTKIQKHKQFEYIFHFVDKDGTQLDPAKLGVPPGVPKEMRHLVSFKPLGGNKTEMTISEFGYTTEAARNISKLGMDQCLDKMADLFKKKTNR
jgi:uncharacterized protein YndB with AHSA1/START domain